METICKRRIFSLILQESENTTRTRGLETRHNLNATWEPSICYGISTVCYRAIRVFIVSLMYNILPPRERKSRTTDTSTRDQKWGLKFAIYVPGWGKHHDIYNYLPKPIAEFRNRFSPFLFDWRVSFSTSFPKITRRQLKVMHLFPSGWQAHNHAWADIICKEKRSSKGSPLRNHYFQGIWALNQREGRRYLWNDDVEKLYSPVWI